MLKALRTTGQLSPQSSYTLDYDNQVIPTAKYDALTTYRQERGYQPGVASIGSKIVYVEGRNGNSQAKYQQDQTLRRAFGLLDKQDIAIARFRADSASYQQAVVEQVTTHCERFYIRAKRSAGMAERIRGLPASAWKKIKVSGKHMEVADITDWQPFQARAAYRLVVSRIERSSEQGELFGWDRYTWRAILTNDTDWKPECIVGFYNQRGAAERNFDVLGNDFGWKNLPCSFLGENTAYMILTAIYGNLYQYLIEELAAKLDWLRPSFRLKKFIFRFISVPAKWIRTGRQDVLNLYTSRDYTPLRC